MCTSPAASPLPPSRSWTSINTQAPRTSGLLKERLVRDVPARLHHPTNAGVDRLDRVGRADDTAEPRELPRWRRPGWWVCRPAAARSESPHCLLRPLPQTRTRPEAVFAVDSPVINC